MHFADWLPDEQQEAKQLIYVIYIHSWLGW